MDPLQALFAAQSTKPAPVTPQGGSSNVQTATSPAPTQSWNGQQIPASINTKNLVSYDPKTGNKTFKLPVPNLKGTQATQQGNGMTTGGVYTEDKNGNLVNTGHTSYGGEPAVAGQERDDMIPVSLGGTNSNSQNIQDVPMSAAAPQDKAETAEAKAVKSGAVQPKAGITDILSKKAQIAGAQPKQGTAANFGSALKDALGNMFVQPTARLGVEGYNYAKAGVDLAKNGGKPSVQATKDINATRNLPLGIGKVTPSNPNTVKGVLQVAMDAFNTAGLGDMAAHPIDTLNGIADAFKGVASDMASKSAATGAEEASQTKVPEIKGNNTTEAPNTTKTPTNETPKSLKDVTPDYNKNMEGDKITNANGESQYRVNPAKTFGAKTVNPSASEFANAQEVDKLGDLPTKGGRTAQSQFVDNGISNKAEGMRGNLQAEDKASPLDAKAEKAKVTDLVKSNLPQDIQDRIGYISKDSPLAKAGVTENPQTPLNKALQDAMNPEDNLPKTAAGRYYGKVLDELNSYDGTREGKLDLRQSIDTAYKQARGKLAFGSDSQNALDETNTDIRDDINKDLKATTQNTDTQASLDKQSKLYRAKDVLDAKAKTEGSTYGERHPTQVWLGRRLGSAAAVTGGVALAAGGSLSTLATNARKAIGGEINKIRGKSAPVKTAKPKVRTVK